MTGKRVLVVEDEPVIRDLMVEVLTDAGFDVDEASTSDEAVRLLDADGYKLLVTDIHMPGDLDGTQLAARTQQTKPGLPVVFVTGRPDVLDRLRHSGIRGAALPKPFALAALVETVRNLVAEPGP